MAKLGRFSESYVRELIIFFLNRLSYNRFLFVCAAPCNLRYVFVIKASRMKDTFNGRSAAERSGPAGSLAMIKLRLEQKDDDPRSCKLRGMLPSYRETGSLVFSGQALGTVSDINRL